MSKNIDIVWNPHSRWAFQRIVWNLKYHKADATSTGDHGYILKNDCFNIWSYSPYTCIKIAPSKAEKNHQSHVYSSICFHESIKPGWKDIRDELIWLGGLMETFRWEKVRAEGRYKNKGLYWRNSPLSLSSYITDHHSRFCKILPSVKALFFFFSNISNMWKRLIFMEKL